MEIEAWSKHRLPLHESVAADLAAAGLVSVQLDTEPGHWVISADSRVGVVISGDVELRVVPRLAIPQLMFLLSYARDPRGWRDLGPAYAEEEDLFAAVATAFAAYAERAITPTPLRGYVTIDETTVTMRGRLRVGDQVGRWPGLPIPLEVTYDDFTLDIEENRLLRGAAELLLRLALVPTHVRKRLLAIRVSLDETTPTRPGPGVRAPEPTRLNASYASALALAELILRSTSISTTAGTVRGVAFMFDMNRVFEDFLATAVGVAIERHGGHLVEQYKRRHLDSEHGLPLKPDLTWWHGGACRAVIDAKYKRLDDGSIPNADAYQMLAYCLAFGLDSGYLVYAKDAGEHDRIHTINEAGKVIRVRAIDVEQPPAVVLGQIDELAAQVATG